MSKEYKWYVPNSAHIYYIKPEKRLAGGGVSEDMLLDTWEEAIALAIEYTKNHIETSKRHLKLLQAQM